MYCPNILCPSDGWAVGEVGPEEWIIESDRFGAWRAVASQPPCPTCGANLRVDDSGQYGLYAPISDFLQSLAG